MKIEKKGSRITVTTDGDFDLSICPELKALLEEDILNDRITHICFDLQKTEFIDSSGLGLILWGYKQLAPEGGKVSVINSGPSTTKIFEVAGLCRILQVKTAGREQIG